MTGPMMPAWYRLFFQRYAVGTPSKNIINNLEDMVVEQQS